MLHEKNFITNNLSVVLVILLLSAIYPANIQANEAFPVSRLQTDWMYQDHGLDLDDCFTSSTTNTVEQKMVSKVISELSEYGLENDIKEEFNKLCADNISGADNRWKAVYFKAAELRRKERLKLLTEKFPNLVYTKHYNIGGSHYSYTEELSDALHPESCEAAPGAKLCLLSIDSDCNIVSNDLLETKQGVFRDPCVSYDGKKILFSKRDSLETDDFHIYEYDVDKKTTRQLTFGIGFADYEPCYLPDGNIVFVSTRCGQNVDCWWVDSSNMYIMDKDGGYMRRIGFDQVQTNYPQVLDDGRVIYTRWDYNDRGQIYPQPLFIMNYDGTAQTEFYGNNSWFPTAIIHARGISGSQKVIAVASGHHMGQRGKLIMIDRTRGTQEASGVQLICPPRETEAVIVDKYGVEGEQFQYPYPIDEEHFIVTFCPEGGPEDRMIIPYGLYLMDINGRRELIAYDDTISCNQPVPLISKPIPVLKPSVINWADDKGTFFVQDVYVGPGLEGIERGTIKSLRVVALEYRAAAIGIGANRGPGGVSPNTTPIACRNGSWDVKRVLGSVPINEDGSAYFEVPARTPVYFQLLDDNGYVVQSMRSWSTLQPNEVFSCIGCHEDKNTLHASVSSPTSSSYLDGPQKLTPLVDPTRGFSFVRDVQPILDTHCVQCHTGGKKADGTDAPFCLMGNSYDPKTERSHDYYHGYRENLRDYSVSYMNLVNEGEPNEIVDWLNVQSIPPMLPPYNSGSSKSKLLSQLREGHNDVVLSEHELEILACWIDLQVPFCGSYTESNLWSDRQKAEYDYYMNKRNRMEEFEARNIAGLIRLEQLGKDSFPPEIDHLDNVGGPEGKKQFMRNWFADNGTIPIIGTTTGQRNGYRNLAINPYANMGEPKSYPHASSNSEFAFLPENAAKNVISGDNEKDECIRAWRPNKRTDLWLTIDFGRPVDIDKVVLSICADSQQCSYWKSATLTFSDGSSEEIILSNTDEPQEFKF
ncbi:MAG: hypothetical protein ACRC2T_12460, partial [Thermoguttaceae bacterium]